MNKRYIIVLLLSSIAFPTFAWNWWPLPMANPDTCQDHLYGVGEISSVFSSGNTSPYFIRANQYGNISAEPMSGNISLGIIKPATRPCRWFDYDFGLVLTGRVQGNPQLHTVSGTGYFREFYAHVRLYIIDITAGIHPVHYGVGNEQLSSGSWIVSSNAHPIPRITVGIDNWTAFPGLFGYAEIKGGVSVGILSDHNPYVTHTKWHHLFAGLQLGGKLPINVSYELHHAAQWGGYSAKYGDLSNNLSALFNVMLGRSGGSTANEQMNAQGNHIISQILKLTAKGESWRVETYWQNMNEDGGFRFIGTGQNKADFLLGIHMAQTRWRFISGLTYEYIRTTNQSGVYHDKDGLAFGGNDNYYNNKIYAQGWTYFGNIIGSPLLTPDNNRVCAHFVGIKGDIFGFQYRALYNHAENYGTYNTPHRSYNNGMLVEVFKQVPKCWNIEFGLSLAGDWGTQYGNHFGAQITIRKKGLILTY